VGKLEESRKNRSPLSINLSLPPTNQPVSSIFMLAELERNTKKSVAVVAKFTVGKTKTKSISDTFSG
jgi:hypothetical protein